MKNLIIGLIVLTTFSCNQLDSKKNKMEQARTVEMVLFKTNEGITLEEGKNAMKSLSGFIAKQPGFVSRKTSISDDGEFLDIVFWKDLQSAITASEKAMKEEQLAKVFSVINQQEMTFKHFEIFNSH